VAVFLIDTNIKKKKDNNDEKGKEEEEEQTNQTEQSVCCGAMINLWHLYQVNHENKNRNKSNNEKIKSIVGKLKCKLIDYIREPSTSFTSDSQYFVVTAHHCNIDLFDTANGTKVMTLVHNTCYLFSHLKVVNQRLFVTVNGRWIRVYQTKNRNKHSKKKIPKKIIGNHLMKIIV